MPTIEERALQQAAAAWLVAGCPPPRSLEGFKTNYRATCIALCRAIEAFDAKDAELEAERAEWVEVERLRMGKDS